MSEPTITPDAIPAETPEEAPEPPALPTEPPGEEEQQGEETERLATPEETPAPQPEALSEKDVEKRIDKLGREAERHKNRVLEIMEEDVTLLVPCAMCESIIPGYVMAGTFNEERRQQVRVFLGDKKPRELRKDPHSTLCEVCGGEGVVDTDSQVSGFDEVVCLDCGGKGVTGERFAPVAQAGAPAVASAPANGPTTPGPQQLPPDVVASLREHGYMAMPMRTTG